MVDKNIENIPDCCIKADSQRPCKVCGNLTNYVEYCVETPLCSNECISKFYEELFQKVNKN